MYCAFYGLRERPFKLHPDLNYLYLSESHRTALDHLEYGIQEEQAFVVLTGEVGAGKSTLLRYMLSQLPEDTESALVFNTNVTSDQLLRLILIEFELLPTGDKAMDLDRLFQYLVNLYAAGRKAVLVIDEAQNLSRLALEEVRMLSNLQSDSEPLLQIILVGQPDLLDTLRKPYMTQLAQRISVKYHLPGLSEDETRAYIIHRMATGGSTRKDVFRDDAVRRIHKESGGIPRIINNLCDYCLVAGFADELEHIDERTVEAVLEERGLGFVQDADDADTERKGFWARFFRRG